MKTEKAFNHEDQKGKERFFEHPCPLWLILPLYSPLAFNAERFSCLREACAVSFITVKESF